MLLGRIDKLVLSPVDCTKHNLCGAHGYCTDGVYDVNICECKFWWRGRYCEECKLNRIDAERSERDIRFSTHLVSGTGKQVIIVGSLLFIFVVLFHVVPPLRKAYQKRKNGLEAQPKRVPRRSTTSRVSAAELLDPQITSFIDDCQQLRR